jgi:hypothetical protein
MPLDPSIILGARPPQIDFAQLSPINAMTNVMKFKQADQESQLNALKMAEYERTRTEEEGSRNYLAKTDLSTPEGRAGLRQFGKTGLAYEKSLSEAETAALNRKETQFKIQKARQDFVAQAQRDTSQNPSDANITAYKEDLMNNPLFSDDEKKQFIANADRLLALPIAERKTVMSSRGASASELKPTLTSQSLGGTARVISTPAFGGTATVVPGSAARVTATVADTLAREKFNFEKANPGYELKEAEDGSIVGVNKRTLQAFPVTLGGATTPAVAGGAPATAPTALKGKGTALTESQGNATAYGMRMLESDKLLKDLEKSGTTSGGRIKAAVQGTLTSLVPFQGENLAEGAGNVMNVLPSVLGGPSESQQMYEQAKKNFITAVLRKESGAAIGASEFATEEKKYFPQAGESEKVIAQKQRARELAIQAMKIQAGPGAKSIGGGAAADPLGIR